MAYRDLPVFPMVADLGQSVRRSLRYEPEETRIGFGVHPAEPVQSQVRERIEATAVAESPDALDAVEAFLDEVAGRFKGFWLPTSVEDVTVVAAAGAAAVRIQNSSFSDWSHLAGRHVQFLAEDGQRYSREVLLVEPGVYAGESIITLDAALPDIGPAIWRVSRLLLVRLVSDEITFDFAADNHARIRFAAIELLGGVASNASEGAQPLTGSNGTLVYLYRITRRYGVRNIYSMHLTSHDAPISSGAVTWESVPIDHGGLSVSTEGDSDKLDLQLFAWPGNPFEDWLPIHIGQPTGVVLSLAHIDETTGLVLEAPTVLFRGLINHAERQGFLIKARAVSPLAYGDKRVPRFFLQTRCNYQLYDGSTCRVPESVYRLEGTVEAIDAAAGSIDFESNTLSGKASDWLPGGYLQIGEAPTVEVRTIRDAQILSATRHRLFLNASLRLSQVGDACSAWPGCDRTPGHCQNRFDNFVNYGGHPLIPHENPTLKAMPLQNAASSPAKK